MVKNAYLKDQIGESEEFYFFQDQIRKAAKIERPVLLIGERGTGKEFAASKLHYLSNRWKNHFLTLNCAALPPSLIETELFGHEAGAYTGAEKKRKGRFEEADKGTIFLDEISLIPIEVQEKILRVVEYGAFERVGSSETIESDVRIIGAANQNLPDLCRQGKFKQDLLDRLSFEVLFVPPLRKRKEDIILLASFFAGRMAGELGRKNNPILSDPVKEKMLTYSWPGNIRELKNVIERAVYRSDSDLIKEITLDPFQNPYEEDKNDNKGDKEYLKNYPAGEASAFPAASVKGSYPVDFKNEVERFRKNLIMDALEKGEGNQRKAAELLSLSYDQYRGFYRKYIKPINADY